MLLGTGSLAACSSSSTQTPPTDGGVSADTGKLDGALPPDATSGRMDSGHAGKDATAGDSTSPADDGDFDAGSPPVPRGTTLDKGQIVIDGITDDGYVVYTTGNSVKAVAVAGTGTGGTPTTLLDAGEAGAAGGLYVRVLHDDVFIWSNIGVTTITSTLTFWSHTLEKPTQLSTTSAPLVAAASDDSTAIVYAGGLASDGGATTALYGATVASLATPASLIAGIDPGLTNSSCPPYAAFSGSGATLYAVIATCTPAMGDGGSEGPEVVTSFPVATWKANTVIAGATVVSPDGTGVSVAFGTGDGEVELVPLAGGAPLVLDSAADAGAALGPTSNVYLSKQDAFVLYNTGSGALITSLVSGTTATTLATAGAADLDALSPSEGFALIDTGFDATFGLVSGLALASTATRGVPTAFVSGANEAALFGDAFTADSAFVLYMVGVGPDDNGFDTGTLTAASVGKPGTPITIASMSGTTQGESLGLYGLGSGNLSNFLTAVGSPSHLALTGSQIVYADNFNTDNGIAGQVDLKLIDLSATTAAKTLMTAADPSFLVSTDKKYLVYSITFGSDTDGVYSIALP